MLNLDDFKHVVEHAPLFAIDLVIVNANNEILLGKRNNAPAQDFWFVPGGRVFKNESLEQAFERISETELGFNVKRSATQLLGLFDHFYDDSFFSGSVSTHYINATHAIIVNDDLSLSNDSLPIEQHEQYKWVAIDSLESDSSVHKFSKVFLPQLKEWLNND